MPLRLFAIPDEEAETNHYEIAIPKIGSWILTHAFGRRRAGPEGRAAATSARRSGRCSSRSAIMVGIGFADAGARLLEPVSALEGRAVREPLVPARRHADDAVGFRRRPVRLVHGRDRPAALCRLRPAAHRRCGLAGRRRARSTTSLVTFVVVYAFVFGFGSYYLAKLCAKARSRSRSGARRRFDDRPTEAEAAASRVPDESLRRRPGRSAAADRRVRRRRHVRLRHGIQGRGLLAATRLVGGSSRFAVAMYVIVDGFDLGVGILFTAAETSNWRDRMMLSVAPIWDGNETWLVLGGGGLFAVFCVAYAILMPALYIPLIADADRADLPRRRLRVPLQGRHGRSAIWDYAFHYGSLARDLRAGHGARRFRAGLPDRGRAASRAAPAIGSRPSA